MNIQEARPFVANFVSGDYTPQQHESFLEWVENAQAEELDLIAREDEAMHERWQLGEGPSVEWMQRMEEKLDRSDRRVRSSRRACRNCGSGNGRPRAAPKPAMAAPRR